MTHDSKYFSERAAEARAAAWANARGEQGAVAGELALAYRALARRRAVADSAPSDNPSALPLSEAADPAALPLGEPA